MHEHVPIRPLAVLLSLDACGPRVAGGAGSGDGDGSGSSAGASVGMGPSSDGGGSSASGGGSGSGTGMGSGTGAGGSEECMPANGWTSIAAGSTNSWGKKDDGEQYWWGKHPYGISNEPQKQPLPFEWRSVQFGGPDPAWIGVDVAGSLWSWTWAEPVPERIGTRSDWKQIATAHLLAEDGTLYPWPWYLFPESDPPPWTAVGEPGWLAVAGDGWSTCGLRVGGEVWCWGSNQFGQLGDGTLEDRADPVKVASDETWVQVSYGDVHACAVSAAGTLWCWGDNTYGQAGLGADWGPYPVPTQVGTKTDWVYVGAGGMHSCGLDASGTAYCWGRADYGALGIPDVGYAYEPAEVPGGPWSQLSVGGTHNCAIRADTTAWCWGSNLSFAIGDGQPGDDPRFEPTQVCG